MAEVDEYYRARLRVIAGLDDMVKDLVETLDRHGILDSTYIMYTTDNGYHIGQHRMGPGKKCGFEEDINIPFVARGPGIPKNKKTDAITTHTDLAPTFMDIFGLDSRPSFDGRHMPISKKRLDEKDNNTAAEYVNVEFWGSGTPSEFVHLHESAQKEHPHGHPWKNNTYKAVRVIGSGYNLYYAVWCTNEHELYDMTNDPGQVDNLLSEGRSKDNVKVNGFPVHHLANRLDALLLVLKSCQKSSCREPWHTLHPKRNVNSLADAMNTKYDAFYRSQVKISFSACMEGYLIEFEGPQKPKRYKGSNGGQVF